MPIAEAQGRLLLTHPLFDDAVTTVRQRRLAEPYGAWRRGEERRLVSEWPQPLLLAAGDHPARLLTAWKGNPCALADRGQYLRTLASLLAANAVHGVEATPDVMEDLLILDALWVSHHGPSFLDGRVLIGTVNRSGLAGTRFEMADEDSAFTVDSAQQLRLDGVKWMWRLAADDPFTVKAQRALRQGLCQAYAARLPVMLEVDWVERREGSWVSVLDEPGRMVELAGVASGWGPTSCGHYLELPCNRHLPAALRATTLPICVLPPEKRLPAREMIEDYQAALGLPVAGQLLGRDLMLAPDPLELGSAIARLWCG